MSEARGVRGRGGPHLQPRLAEGGQTGGPLAGLAESKPSLHCAAALSDPLLNNINI